MRGLLVQQKCKFSNQKGGWGKTEAMQVLTEPGPRDEAQAPRGNQVGRRESFSMKERGNQNNFSSSHLQNSEKR